MDEWRVQKFKDFPEVPLKSHNNNNIKMEQLSGVMIIIIIGGGVLTFVMLFVFAKRQIMRFTLRSRRGPHVTVGIDAKKTLRREIERRLDCIPKIAQEPKLLWSDKYIVQPDRSLPPYYYRMRAVDDVKILEQEIEKSDNVTRGAYESLRAFLLTTLAAALNGSGQRMIHQFCDMYEQARHDPNEFGCEEYEAYHRLLMKLIDAAKQLINYNSRRTSPARTPKKQTKMHSLLDPSRLRPPPMSSNTGSTASNLNVDNNELRTAGQHTKHNLTLGLQGCDSDIGNNPLHLQQSTDRDIIIRSRITSHLDDNGSGDENSDAIHEDNEIMSISSKQLQSNSSVV